MSGWWRVTRLFGLRVEKAELTSSLRHGMDDLVVWVNFTSKACSMCENVANVSCRNNGTTINLHTSFLCYNVY